ncbi:MAG: hypothetical protein D6765_13700, partial [Bacteroidetes bacterium]
MKKWIFLLPVLLFAACQPEEDPDIELGPLPAPPEFSMQLSPDNPNVVLLQDLSQGAFARLWEMPGGTPNSSTEPQVEVLYAKAGTYTITLHIAAEGGNGTANASKTITIEQDATLACDDKLALLTGDCNAEGKCWTFSTEAGAVTVGSDYGLDDWFTSTANGLQAEQYDDSFCFFFDGFVFVYANNGTTIDPWSGYVPVAYDPAPTTFTFSPGTGRDGRDQILLPEGYFMGVWDSGNVLDIETLTETELVVRTPIVDQDGNPT